MCDAVVVCGVAAAVSVGRPGGVSSLRSLPALAGHLAGSWLTG